MTKERKYQDRAERLKKLRGDIGVDVFAKELGINLTTYYRYERGETPISDGHLKLAEIFSQKKAEATAAVVDPSRHYDLHGGYRPDPERFIGAQRGTPQWRAFELLGRIYATKDETLITAAVVNLTALVEIAEKQNKEKEKKSIGVESI
jgi:transcriptional regulator with XRE-family HTH domain